MMENDAKSSQKTIRRRPRRRQGGKTQIMKPKPDADKRLKQVFSTIGVPEKLPFEPDPFQLEALSAIGEEDCLVTAPTGAGKTWIAEQAIAQILESGGKCWYASPLKALSNAKHLDFSELFGSDNVGILTGDRKENPEGPVLVGTTEILRNQLYDAMHRGEDLPTDFVILDEAHFLGDEDRGVVWEEIMIYLPQRIPMLLLSATVGNAHQIAGWLSSIRSRRCAVVEETQRPVPLYPLFLHPSGTLLPLFSHQETSKKKRLHKRVRGYVNTKKPPLMAPPRKLPPMGDILRILRKYRLLPAIFFLKSRADCDNALELCLDNRVQDPNRKERISRRLQELLSHSAHLSDHRQIWHIENLAVGSHHSGHLPAWKIIIEKLMTDGLLDAVFATSTVAAGVNFPARTVVFFNSDRFNGIEFMPLTPTELHQMTGRAGRRGMDNIGFCVAVPGKFMDVELVGKLFNSPPTDVVSQIKINFSMALNLLLSHTPSEIKELLKRSFATYLLMERKKKKRKSAGKTPAHDPEHLWRDFLRHLDFLKDTGYVASSDLLTEDGVWASQLRVDDPLMIAEGLRKNLFPVSDFAQLAGIIASFVNERETDDRMEKKIVPKQLIKSFEGVKKGLRNFVERLIKKGFAPKPLYFRPALTLYLWASDTLSWDEVLKISDLAEGDLAMLTLRTADNLRHIRSLGDVFPEAAQAADKAIESILRDPVVAFYEP
jgi:superfamily II RNA helicase